MGSGLRLGVELGLGVMVLRALGGDEPKEHVVDRALLLGQLDERVVLERIVLSVVGRPRLGKVRARARDRDRDRARARVRDSNPNPEPSQPNPNHSP